MWTRVKSPKSAFASGCIVAWIACLGAIPAVQAREAQGREARDREAPAPLPPPRDSLSFQGVFNDSAFPPPAPVRLEVLETGDTLRIVPGESFRLRLPVDTLWNLCFSGEDTRIEKCFELVYLGADSAFSFTMGEGPATVIESPAAAAPIAAANTDTAATEEADAETYRPDDAVQLKKVLVRAQRAPKRSLGKSTVSAKIIKRMPGLAEADVIRSIQALPGVVSSSDFSTKIYVRGGGSDQNLILLDNAVVYSPVHFFGLFSTFLVEALDEVNFYKGGFPPEYGNRLSSVLDITSRKGGKDTVDTWFKGSSLKISTFASQAHTEGRSGPVRWLFAGRGTYIETVLDGLRAIGATDLDLPYFFYDLQGSANYDFGGGKSALASFYNGRDKLIFTPFEVEWGNTAIPLNISVPLGKDLASNSAFSYSHFSQSFGLENIFEFYNKIVTVNYKQEFEYTGLENHRLAFGTDVNWMETIFVNEQIIAKVRLRDYTEFWLSSLFLQDKWTLGNAELTSGARLTHSSRLETPGFEPRLSVKYRLPANQSLDFHVGYYMQYVNSIQFGDQENLNEFYYPAKDVSFRTVNPSSSILLSAGYGADKVLGEWDFTLEGYYKTLDHLTIFAPNSVPDSILYDAGRDLGDLFKEAEGYSLGYELSLRRPEGLLFGGVSYSSGLSVILEEFDSISYFPKWHQPHSFKADLAINWRGKDGLFAKDARKYFRTSTQAKFATGLPYTEFVGYMPAHLRDQNQGSSAGGPNPEFNSNVNAIRGNRNQALVPPYFRWDIKVVDWGREGKWNFSWTVLNITNHKNIFFYSYDREVNPPELIEITQFPFFPMLFNYEYYF